MLSYEGALCGAEVRRDLVALCRRPQSRSAVFHRDRPTDWRPSSVLDPRYAEWNFCFTDTTAWDYIAELLEGGIPVGVITLETPAGATGYVIQTPHPSGSAIYIKLQVGSGRIYGRSFHYSYV